VSRGFRAWLGCQGCCCRCQRRGGEAVKAANDKSGDDWESVLYSDEYYAAQKAKCQGLGKSRETLIVCANSPQARLTHTWTSTIHVRRSWREAAMTAHARRYIFLRSRLSIFWLTPPLQDIIELRNLVTAPSRIGLITQTIVEQKANR
jgi:hypothetical protein